MKYLFLLLLILPSLSYSSSPKLDKINTKFKSLKNNEISLKDFKGKKVIVRFWASWCTPCKRDLKLLDAFYMEQKAQGIEVLGVAVDEDIPAAKAYLQGNPVHFPVIFDLKKQLPESFAAESLASLFYFNEKGKLIKTLKTRPMAKEFYAELVGVKSK